MKTINATLAGLLGAALILVAGCYDPFSYGTRSGGGSVPDVATYEADVYPILLSNCSICHGMGGVANSTSYQLSSNSGSDYNVISALVTPGDPEGSLLLQKASGSTSHGGSSVLAATSVEYQTIAVWIEQGAAQQ